MRRSEILPHAMVACALFLAGCQGLRPGRGTDSTVTKQAADIQFALARSLEQQGEPQQAVDVYLKVTELDSSRSDAYLRLAILHDRLGFPRDSAGFYQKALEANPGSPDIFTDMGYSQYLHGHWEDAEANLRQALAVQPNHRRARNNLGLILARTGRTDEALSEFRRGGCSRSEAHANVAFALSLERDWESARRQYQLSLDADPKSRMAQRGLKNLDSMLAGRGKDPVLEQPAETADPGAEGSSVVPAAWAQAPR